MSSILDNWFTCASSRQSLSSHIKRALELLQSHGFLINKEKFCLTPSQSLLFLGFQIDSIHMNLKLAQEWIYKIRNKEELLLHSHHVSVRVAIRMLGLLTSAIKAVPWAKAHI